MTSSTSRIDKRKGKHQEIGGHAAQSLPGQTHGTQEAHTRFLPYLKQHRCNAIRRVVYILEESTISRGVRLVEILWDTTELPSCHSKPMGGKKRTNSTPKTV